MSEEQISAAQEYGADQIQILEGLEAVRKRPGMYIGSTSSKGLHHLVYEIVDNAVDEALAGFCDTVKVYINEDNSITVRDNGRGIPVGINKKKGIPAVEVVFTILHAGGKFGGGGYKVSGGLHGVGASVVNALSTWLEVDIFHEGKIYRQRYERGKVMYPLKIVGDTDKRGTEVRFLPDPTIFEETVFDFSVLKQRLREMAFLTKGLKIVLKDKRPEENVALTFHYEGGIREYVEYLNKSKEVLYPIALQACKDVMGVEGQYVALKSNFEDIWNNNGISGDVITAGSESLFEIGYSNAPARGRMMYTFGIKHNSEDEMTTMKQGSQVGPVPTLYFEYDKNDTRRDVTCCPFQWNKGKQELQSFKSWSFGKLRYEWTNRLIPAGNDDGINRLYMRYADVVLMRAELENELNGPSAAAPYLEKIHKRALGGDVSSYINQVSASKETMFNAIVKERGLEFAGEFIRKADLIRWGLLKTKMDEAKAKMNAIVNLKDYDAEHPYSQLSGHVYYKRVPYSWSRGDVSYTTANAKLVIYGLNYGETELDPEGYTEYADSKGDAATWIKATSLDDVKDYLYVQDPDKRQYWPIFNVNLNDNASLKNYSWY